MSVDDFTTRIKVKMSKAALESLLDGMETMVPPSVADPEIRAKVVGLLREAARRAATDNPWKVWIVYLASLMGLLLNEKLVAIPGAATHLTTCHEGLVKFSEGMGRLMQVAAGGVELEGELPDGPVGPIAHD